MSKAAGYFSAPGIHPANSQDQGVYIAGSAFISVVAGGTIAATLQKQNPDGTWTDVPNARAVITAADEFLVHGSGRYRLNVTAATGNWHYEIRPELGNR